MKSQKIRKFVQAAMIASACLGLAGCGDKVLFVTATSAGVDASLGPGGGLKIGTAVIEGYYAPVYSNGSLPPVYSRFSLDGRAINPSIKQTYATGAASVVVQGDDAGDLMQLYPGKLQVERVLECDQGKDAIERTRCSDAESGVPEANLRSLGMQPHGSVSYGPTKVRAFVGTATHVGFRLAASNVSLAEIVLGYKRIVASHVPVARKIDCPESVRAKVGVTSQKELKCDFYPSTLATIKIDATVSTELGDDGAEIANLKEELKAAEAAIAGAGGSPSQSQLQAKDLASKELAEKVQAVTDATLVNASLNQSQFFATGRAAEALALNPEVRSFFKQETKSAVQAIVDESNSQRGDALSIISCYTISGPKRRALLRANAVALDIVSKENGDNEKEYYIALTQEDAGNQIRSFQFSTHQKYACDFDGIPLSIDETPDTQVPTRFDLN